MANKTATEILKLYRDMSMNPATPVKRPLAETEQLRAENEKLRELLRAARDGLDEYWLTTDEGIALSDAIDALNL